MIDIFGNMTARPVRRLAVIVAVAASGLAAASSREAIPPPVVYAADVASIIHPVSAEYMIETMARADRAGAALVVFTLRTPGGLVDSTRDIDTCSLPRRRSRSSSGLPA